MDYLNIPYEEEENSGILGIMALGRSVPQLKIPQADLTITNSADILRYLYGCHAGNPAREEFLRRTEDWPLRGALQKILLLHHLFCWKCSRIQPMCLGPISARGSRLAKMASLNFEPSLPVVCVNKAQGD